MTEESNPEVYQSPMNKSATSEDEESDELERAPASTAAPHQSPDNKLDTSEVEDSDEPEREPNSAKITDESTSEVYRSPNNKLATSEDEDSDEPERDPASTTTVQKSPTRILDTSDDEDSDEPERDPAFTTTVNKSPNKILDTSEDEDSDGPERDPTSTTTVHQSPKNESASSEDEESDGPEHAPTSTTTLYDFDIMMAKKKEENSRKRKRRNYDIINDNDDIIADIITQMKDAVEADNEANRNKMAATKKLKLLPFVMSQLRKVDLRDAFLDSDVLSVMTEWLAPLPDRGLPHLHIRESMLKTLIDFNLYDVDRIKGSGIGKAIMYLFKHPKETKENKQRAKQLISCWSRPIFQLDSSFDAISREEREQRDLELMSKLRRVSRNNDGSDTEGASQSKKTKEEVAQKPGDKGWIPRARVPAPSMRDYVIRPRSKVDGDIGKSSRRPSNMLEKYMKSQQDRRRATRQQRAVNMKIDRG